jgi:hypothetical protein
MTSTKPPIKSLHEQISSEVKRLSGDEAVAWLAAPQPLLGMRIPARMIAIGEGLTVLDILRRARRNE